MKKKILEYRFSIYNLCSQIVLFLVFAFMCYLDKTDATKILLILMILSSAISVSINAKHIQSSKEDIEDDYDLEEYGLVSSATDVISHKKVERLLDEALRK